MRLLLSTDWNSEGCTLQQSNWQLARALQKHGTAAAETPPPTVVLSCRLVFGCSSCLKFAASYAAPISAVSASTFTKRAVSTLARAESIAILVGSGSSEKCLACAFKGIW